MTRALNLLVPLATIAVAGFFSYQFMGSWTPDNLASPSDSGGSSSGGSSQVSDDVKGSASDSLLQTENFRKAVRTIAGEAGAARTIAYVRLAPGRINTQVYRGTDGARLITIGRDGTEAQVITTSSTNTGDGFAPPTLNPLAPQRIISGIAERQHRSSTAVADDIDYMVITGTGSLAPTWSVFLKSGSPRFYVAKANGKRVIEPGKPVAPSSPPKTAQDAQKLADCVRKANGDVVEIQSCLQGG
ncbi:MAG: hypothetical protein U0R70_01450 [Solirubrobacteraceae bacterium]